MDKLHRTEYPNDEIVFFAMPYGRKPVSDGSEADFNDLYNTVYAPAVRSLGRTPERADEVYGTTQGVLEATWRAIQRAGVVVVDFTTRSPDVALEFGWAMCLHKRMIVLAENLEHVPTDVRGQLRPIRYSFDWAGISKMREELTEQLRQVLQEPAAEMTLKPLEGAEPGRAVVEKVDRESIIVRDVRTRRVAEMHKTDVDYRSEVPSDMTKRFREGMELDGTFITEPDGRTRFTQRAGQRNPWPDLQAAYPPGRVFSSRVVKVTTAGGAFVAVAHEVNGYIPPAEAHAAGLQVGQAVEVVVLSLDPERQRISLTLANRPAASRAPAPTGSYPQVGERLDGTVTRVEPERDGRGGYLLVRLDDWPRLPRPAILHCSAMTPLLREAVNAGLVENGHQLTVEVIDVDPVRCRVQVRDVAVAAAPEPTAPPADGADSEPADSEPGAEETVA